MTLSPDIEDDPCRIINVPPRTFDQYVAARLLAGTVTTEAAVEAVAIWKKIDREHAAWIVENILRELAQ